VSNEERSSILGAVQPPPKLLIERLTEGEVTCLRLSGIVDEQFDAPGLAQTIASRYLILDLGGVDRISSFGIRQWVDFIANIGPRLGGVYYVEGSPKVVDHATPDIDCHDPHAANCPTFGPCLLRVIGSNMGHQTGALPESDNRWMLENKRAFVLNDELGTKPRFYYFVDK